MKALLCTLCNDLIRLGSWERTCTCGKTKGHYLADGKTIEIAGRNNIVLGLDGGSLERAVRRRRGEFTAFVIGEPCEWIRRVV